MGNNPFSSSREAGEKKKKRGGRLGGQCGQGIGGLGAPTGGEGIMDIAPGA